MIWRRVLAPESVTLRELHGILQVAMGWEGIHLYYFDIHAVRYGSIDLHAEIPDTPLSRFGFREGDRFAYLYDMGDYWDHEVRMCVQRRRTRSAGVNPAKVKERQMSGLELPTATGTSWVLWEPLTTGELLTAGLGTAALTLAACGLWMMRTASADRNRQLDAQSDTLAALVRLVDERTAALSRGLELVIERAARGGERETA